MKRMHMKILKSKANMCLEFDFSVFSVHLIIIIFHLEYHLTLPFNKPDYQILLKFRSKLERIIQPQSEATEFLPRRLYPANSRISSTDDSKLVFMTW